MSWLVLTLIAQFLNSIVALFDKYLVTSKKITTPLLYVFYTGVLASLGILIYVPSLVHPVYGLPMFSRIELPSAGVFTILLIACVSQLLALWGMFTSFKKNDASDVVPVIGSFAAISALVIGYLFEGLKLSPSFAGGFALLVLGTLLISHFRFSRKIFFITVASGFGFGLHNILIKDAIARTSFDTGFFWFSLLTTLLSLCLLRTSSVRSIFRSHRRETHIKSTGVILVLNKIVAGIAGILLIKAIELGEVSLVQALGGLQYVFLFIMAAAIGPFTSHDFGENISRKGLYHKFVSISIIFLGFILLFI